MCAAQDDHSVMDVVSPIRATAADCDDEKIDAAWCDELDEVLSSSDG